MGKAVLKTLLVALLFIVMPALLFMILSVFGIALPLVGILMIVFFPIILVGLIIGYRSGRHKKMKQIEMK